MLRAVWFGLVAVVILASDQLIKNAVIASLNPQQSYNWLGNVVRLYLTYNNSAAFSMGWGITWLFTLISACAAVALVFFGLRTRSLGWAALSGLALGGVLGNLSDRLFRAPGFPSGQVVDYIQIPFNFPIFNLADSAICVAAGITVLLVARGSKIGG
ncbi:MAG: signal peptidase II [Micrococcales bacterium]